MWKSTYLFVEVLPSPLNPARRQTLFEAFHALPRPRRRDLVRVEKVLHRSDGEVPARPLVVLLLPFSAALVVR